MRLAVPWPVIQIPDAVAADTQSPQPSRRLQRCSKHLAAGRGASTAVLATPASLAAGALKAKVPSAALTLKGCPGAPARRSGSASVAVRAVRCVLDRCACHTSDVVSRRLKRAEYRQPRVRRCVAPGVRATSPVNPGAKAGQRGWSLAVWNCACAHHTAKSTRSSSTPPNMSATTRCHRWRVRGSTLRDDGVQRLGWLCQFMRHQRMNPGTTASFAGRRIMAAQTLLGRTVLAGAFGFQTSGA